MPEHIPSAHVHTLSVQVLSLIVQLTHGMRALSYWTRRFSPVVLSCLFDMFGTATSAQLSSYFITMVLLSQPTQTLPLCCCYSKQAHSLVVLLTVCSYSVFLSKSYYLLLSLWQPPPFLFFSSLLFWKRHFGYFHFSRTVLFWEYVINLAFANHKTED